MKRWISGWFVLRASQHSIPPTPPTQLYVLGKIRRAHGGLKVGDQGRVVPCLEGRAHDLLDLAGVQVDAGPKDHRVCWVPGWVGGCWGNEVCVQEVG